ncbi:MAG: transglutaminaseTgpA domain-containing protein [Armatimonadota bacterium]|nr:transglutaminaseTgpA domain-containing protein [Armatimonadota bacterium]MDR7510238.1 transglutaminaseTgpA domain-containing protein [Armatimonadota bacterium]
MTRRRAHEAEDAPVARAATLVAILVAVAAVGVQEEFASQAALAAAAVTAGFIVSYLRRRARNTWLKLAVAVLVLVVARDFFRTLVATPYDPRVPLVRLFLWLQVLHSFDLPARRDLKYSLASAVVLVAVGGAYARDLAYGLVVAVFALAATTAVAALYWPEGAPLRGLLRAGAGAGAAVVLAAAAVFVAVPRGEGLRVRWMPVSPRLPWAARLHTRIVNPAYPEADQAGPQRDVVFNPLGYVGFSTFVDLRLRGVPDERLVLRVRSTRPAFWRGLGFDEYTGQGWRMTDPSVEELIPDQVRFVARLGEDEPWPAGSEQVVQTFYVEADQPNVIFAAYRPFEVYFPTGLVAVDRYAGLRSPITLEPGMVYSVISRVPSPTPALLAREHGEIPPSVRERYLQVPRLPDRVRQLAADLAAGGGSPYGKAVAVADYLRRCCTYTLQAPPLPPGADAVDHFLFVTRQGSCEAFSSALAVLLRAAGVPARLVTGYTTGAYNRLTGYYEVRNSDAHAWVEVFQPGVGWVAVDPTPGFAVPSALDDSPGQWLLADGIRWVWRGMAGAGATVPRDIPLQGVLAVLGAAAAAAAAAARTRRGPGRPADPVETAYVRMEHLLRRRGYRRLGHLTPREFVAALPESVRPPADLVTRVFEASRYGGRPATLGDVDACRQALDTLRGAVRRLPRRREPPGRTATQPRSRVPAIPPSREFARPHGDRS